MNSLATAAIVAIAAASLAKAQPSPDEAAPPPADAQASAPDAAAPTSPASPAAEAPPPAAEAKPPPRAESKNLALKPPIVPDKPPEPPKPVRSPVAILQALDKVTAETLRFAAPIGRRVRYKTLIFTVRACETSGADDPQPRASAYVLIESQAPTLPGRPPPDAKQVYRGWMFSTAPALHPFEHPVYDAWLIACSAAAPVA